MDINIGRLLARRALLDGDRLALVSEERRLSFRDLNGEACRAAHALAASGVRAGDRVAALMRNGPDYVALYYGAAKIGAILCAINWRLAAQEIDYILGDSEPKLLVHGTEFAPAISAGGRRGLSASAAETGWRAQIAAAPAQEPQAAVGGGEPLVLVYTSGTTGRPKGAVLTHNQMYWASATMAASHDYRPGDVNLVPTPLFHVGGLSFATLFVHMGATLVLPRAWEPGAVLALIAKERINHFFAVPAMVRSLLEHPDFATADLSSLRWILCGGARVPPELIASAGQRGIPVQQTYGATETAGPATLVDLAHASAKAGSAGLPYFHTELRIVDAAGAELAAGEIGEVQVKAPHVFTGYWRNPEASRAAFAGTWLKTGDLGRRDADGYLYLVDRAKDVIITGGENVYPAELEAVLREHPGITEIAVVGVPDREWGEVPCVVVVTEPGRTVTLDSLRAFCEGRIARYKQPRRLVLRTEPLPRNASGKVLKHELRGALGAPA
ncbi:MAG: long-chain-fatty-acid--CoA ligase [Alphaproteobacteria bacterium]